LVLAGASNAKNTPEFFVILGQNLRPFPFPNTRTLVVVGAGVAGWRGAWILLEGLATSPV
jgi:hypothetical protein